MTTTNYYDAFIAAAPDSNVDQGTAPREKANASVAFRTFKLIHDNPYRYTSDDVIFAVYADRKGIPREMRTAARDEFFSIPRPCLRASDLGKKYGWGIHFDANGRIALYGVESRAYQEFVNGKDRKSVV